MEHKQLKKTLFLTFMIALAIVLHFVEGLFPLSVAVPGIKLGLSNVVSLIALYLYGPLSALLVMVLRVFLVSFLYGGFSGALFSMAGGMLSITAMICIWKLSDKGFGIVGASVMGGIFHNVGQLSAAAFVLGTTTVFSYLPVLMISGTVMGTVTGILGGVLISRLKKYLLFHD